MPSSRFRPAVVRLAVLLALGATAWAQDEETIGIKTISGLRFDPPRFAVKPGAKVKLEIENVDDMAHNFVLAAPGARMEIVTAAMAMPITPEQTFIPPTDMILQHTPVLLPGKSATLEFTAPAAEGVYPFICTYPGHGMVMYGAMYVTSRGEQELPLIANDEHLPEMIREQAKNVTLHAYPAEPPIWYRIFMRDSGPASIAVALPGGQNYCWDTGACRLRYVWRGGFIDPMPHWRGNGDDFAEVRGTIYYRPGTFPLRFGESKKSPTEVLFRGYSVVDKLPEFRYEAGGVEVRELIKPGPHGGIEATYKLSGAKGPVFFVTEPGAGVTVTSEAGKVTDGMLKIPADKARQFTITFTEIPNQEPVGYWPMNDTLAVRTQPLVSGAKGRAAIFDGKKLQVATGITTNELAGGATFAVWAQLAHPPALEQICIGAKNPGEEFGLGANLAGVPGYGVRVKNADQTTQIVAVMPMAADDEWHHLAATLGAKGVRFYLDGKPSGAAALTALPADAELFLGSRGNTDFIGATLDEARIYARTLDAKEIAALYASERPSTKSTSVKTTPKPSAKSPSPSSAKATPQPSGKATPQPSGKATPRPSARPTPVRATPKPSARPTPIRATPKPSARPTPIRTTPKPATKGAR